MKRFARCAVVSALLGLGFQDQAALAQSPQVRTIHEASDAVRGSEIPPQIWLATLTDASHRFSETDQDIRCFEIIVESVDGMIAVSFLPKPDVFIYEDGSTATTRNKSSCGRGITYWYSGSGEFRERSLNR